jgi:chromosome segregation ATPase
MTSPPEQLDLALAERLRQVVDGQEVSESEMRTLADHAGGWARAIDAQHRSAEERLAELNADPASSLAEIAAELRRVDALSHEREEIRRLSDGLEQRTRELRTAWLTHHTDAGSPSGPLD